VKPGGAKAVWLSYLYDARRKISSVADLDGVGGNESRTYADDANGRLLTAALIRDSLAAWVSPD